jgi:hypothetical protein
VPPEYLGREVWARWDVHLVRLFDARMRPIAVHPRKEEGRFSTNHQHIAPQKINGIERGAAHLLNRVRDIGAHADQWAQAMVHARGIQGVRVLQGLIALSRRHPADRIDRACEMALSHDAFRLGTIRTLIGRDAESADQQPSLPGFIDEHPIIRSLADYASWSITPYKEHLHE